MVNPKSLSVWSEADTGELAASASQPPRSRQQLSQQRGAPSPNAIASLVMQRHARLSHFNHFEVLDIPESADRETIRRAFQQAVRRFRPEQLTGEYERLKPLAKEIVCRIGLAYRVLEDDASRAQYRRSLTEYPALAAARPSGTNLRASHPSLRPSSLPSPRSSKLPRS